MNLHENARTCPGSRALIAKRVLQAGRAVTEIAKEFGVSFHTVYKWVHRYVVLVTRLQRSDVHAGGALL